VLILAACGDDDDTASTDAPATPASASTEAPAATEATTAESAGTTPAAAGATVALADSSLGEILVDGAGMTLYMFEPDEAGPSTCTEGCLAAWPALAGPASAGDGVDASLLGTATRPDDGSEQVTCDGWPLYTYAEDAAPGDVTGQGANDKWYVLDATCKPEDTDDAAPASRADARTCDPVGLADSSLGQILVDGAGMTLYMFAPDNQGPSTCTESCLEAWPMVQGPATAGTGVDAALVGTAARPEDGTPQATCNGWPLYTFAQDAAAGDVNGQGVGGNWYVLDATCTPVGK
jgi:predicted lipoprotein with Yx(FWY)xxD motif